MLRNSNRVANTLKSYLMRSDMELPAKTDIEQASETILRLYEASGGATFSLYFGNQAGQRLYSVSVFPDRSYVVEGSQISREVLIEYLHENSDLLADPRCCIGTWYSEETDQTYIDISIVLPNKRKVVSLGRRYNQEGVFDLYRMEYISTGGDGEMLEKMPPVMERLPVMVRGRKGNNERNDNQNAR